MVSKGLMEAPVVLGQTLLPGCTRTHSGRLVGANAQSMQTLSYLAEMLLVLASLKTESSDSVGASHSATDL